MLRRRVVLSGGISLFIRSVATLCLCALASCTYVQQAGMTEWDYKALEAGYKLECRCCGDTPSCRWTNSIVVNGTFSGAQPLE